MSEGIQKVLQAQLDSPLEMGMASLGMGTPARRFVVGSALGALVVWAWRPQVSFDDQGAKSWVMTGDPARSGVTAAPWWALAAVPGVFMAVFL